MDIYIPPDVIYCAGNYARIFFRGLEYGCNTIKFVLKLAVVIK